jgi:uroporphyrinogen-III decarboxylase
MIYAMFDEPDKVQRLLELCLETACTYGRALLATGAQLAVFDSRASCSVISPEQYTEFVQPTHLSLLKSLRADGAEFTSLIVGGNTTPAAESLFATGADLVLSDFNIDPEPFLTLSASHPTVVKVNLDPALFESDIGLEEGTRVAAALLRGRGRAVVSTGIIPYSTPSARLLKARDVIESFEN